MKFFFQVMGFFHVRLYRLTSGKIGGHMNGVDVLLLKTIGRKSGKTRTTPLMYKQDGNDYLIAASAAGAPKHPGWYWNAVKGTDPVEIQVLDQKITVNVTDTQGEERNQYYEDFKQISKNFVTYEEKTKRTIPVLKLSPQA